MSSKHFFLVIDINTTVREDLAFSLASRFGVTVEGAATVRDAIEIFKEKNQYIHLIVINDSNEVAGLLKYLQKNRMRTPCILIADDPNRDVDSFLSANLKHSVHRSTMVKELYEKIPKILQKETLELEEEYCPIPTHLLERVSPIQGDVYIRLGTNKYIRLFAQNDYCSQDDIEKYAIRKGVKHLYLQKKDVGNFMFAINNHLEKVLEQIEQKVMNIMETEALAAETIDTVQAYVLRFGFTEEARLVAEKAIRITEHTVAENSKLSQIFHRFMFHNNRYMPVHSLVIAHVASAICAELQWNAPGTLYKITMAAIFHDISLQNDNLASVRSLKELDSRSGEFTDTEIRDYKSHPFNCAQMIEKFRQIPPDVSQIIQQHHELPDGSGFPRGITANHITPLSAVFIISHEIVRKLLLNKSTFSMEEEFLSLVKAFDNGPTFHSILNVLDPYNKKQKLKLYG